MKKETTASAFNWEYAPAPEAKDHIKLKSQYDLFINGKFVKPNSKKYFAKCLPRMQHYLVNQNIKVLNGIIRFNKRRS